MDQLEKKYDPRIGYSPSIYSIELGEYLMASKDLPSFDWPKPKWRKYIFNLEEKHYYQIIQNAIYQAALTQQGNKS